MAYNLVKILPNQETHRIKPEADKKLRFFFKL
jgi:hypothetical protein